MQNKLIIALDYSSREDAFQLIDNLNPKEVGLKVGSEMFTLWGSHFVKQLTSLGFEVFLDLKFHDIPTTVANACIAAANLGVSMINVHASGGLKMMETAKRALESFGQNAPLLIAVTMLTSMSNHELTEIGLIGTIDEQVGRLAYLAYNAGLDGVVCSAFETPHIKQCCSQQFIAVTPGIRISGDDNNDQVRVVSPLQAIKYGSDYLVVGRSITQAEEPRMVVNSILQLLK